MAFAKKAFVALILRILELILLFGAVSALGAILANYYDSYSIQRYSSLPDNMQHIRVLVTSPIYILGVLLCSIYPLGARNVVARIAIWLLPSLLIFLVSNVFSNGAMLLTSCFIAVSFAVNLLYLVFSQRER